MILPGMLFPVPECMGIMFTIVMLVTTCSPLCYKNMGVAAIFPRILLAGDCIPLNARFMMTISPHETAVVTRDG
jgi:hypothetical protein